MKDKVINENEKCLIARKRLCEKYEDGEEVLRHYIKSKRGYFLNAFFGKNFWKFMLFTLFGTIMLLLEKLVICSDDRVYLFFVYLFTGFGIFAWLVDLSIKLWFWKYSKHVIVSDKGIWIMIFRTGWCSAFDGKKHFFSPSWSLYSWSELSNIYPEQSRISKICKLGDFTMDRWDGEEPVHYLEPDEVDEIEAFAKKYIPASRRRKKRAPKRKFKFSIFDGMV